MTHIYLFTHSAAAKIEPQTYKLPQVPCEPTSQILLPDKPDGEESRGEKVWKLRREKFNLD